MNLSFPRSFQGVRFSHLEKFKVTTPFPISSSPLISGDIILLCITKGQGHLGTNFDSCYSSGSIFLSTRPLELKPIEKSTGFWVHLQNIPNLLEPPLLSIASNPQSKVFIDYLTNALFHFSYSTCFQQSSALYEIIMRILEFDESKHTVLSPFVNESLDIMKKDFGHIENLTEISEAVGISTPHFIRTFTKEMGITPGYYLISVRMDNAKLLLKASSLSIESISIITGYSSANYFGKVFSRHNGSSPSAFRETHATVTENLTKKEQDKITHLLNHAYL